MPLTHLAWPIKELSDEMNYSFSDNQDSRRLCVVHSGQGLTEIIPSWIAARLCNPRRRYSFIRALQETKIATQF
jgi:hypothetical protein